MRLKIFIKMNVIKLKELLFSVFQKRDYGGVPQGGDFRIRGKCLKYLGEVDDTLILQICKYAEFFLKDTLENTSVGEPEDGEAFSCFNPLDLL